MFKLLRKRKANKYGKHIFTFPNGERLFQLKEDYFERMPAKKLMFIQENSNYIAFMGVSKATLEAGHRMIKDHAYQITALSEFKDKEKMRTKCMDLVKLVDQIDTTRLEYDKTNEVIMVSLFDLFFYFDNENPMEWSEETLERKRHYLNTYPYFKSFFFSEVERLYISLQSHLSKLYQLCFNSVKHDGNGERDSKGIEPYRYKSIQNELEILICKEYGISQNEYLNLTIEQYYKYLNEYYRELKSKANKAKEVY
jgi:hypothetical protein